MKITLTQLPAEGVKPAKDYGSKAIWVSARRLMPAAATSFMKDLAPYIPVTDLYRSAAGGLAAIKNKKGSRSPGYSGHNYGHSIDIGVSEAMKTLGFKKKSQLDAWMRERNWFCWRGDGERLKEEWHYDHNRGPWDKKSDTRGDQGLQRMLLDLYGPQFVLKQFVDGADEVQAALKKLNYYHGEIDGKHGPLTRAAITAFQQHWMPAFEPTGKAGPPTQRVLAFVAADYEIVPWTGV